MQRGRTEVQTIRNEDSGETLTILVSEQESAGARQLYQVALPPWRPSPPLHYHVDFTETFSVVEGVLDVYLGRERKHLLLKPEESVTVPVRQLHTFANQRDVTTVITVDTQPAGGVVKAFELAYGIANSGGAAKDGLPRNPLARLLFIRISQGFLPAIPLSIQKAVLALAGFLAKISGLEKRLLALID
jgi:mannose-6-phosphate isomerase-like protein (cupin superfamily)